MNERPSSETGIAEGRTPEETALDERNLDERTPDGRSPEGRAAEVRTAEVRTAEAPRNAERGTIEQSGLLPQEQMSVMRERWDDIQAGFVDDPRTAVTHAEALVDNVVDELTNTFSRERSRLENQWNTGEKVDTEQLRVALQRYRTFFNRLLGPGSDR